MSIRGLKKWALLLTFWLALQTRCLKATDITGDTVTTDLTVEGNATIQGDTISLGTDGSYPGWLAFYTDGSTSVVEFDARHSGNIWKWQQNGGTSLQEQMSLDNSNNLVIYSAGASPTAKITLNPGGTSTITGSVTINGTTNTMPNQTLTGSGSVITEGLGDSRYLSSSAMTIGSATFWRGTGPTMGLNGGTATGAFSFAEGSSTTASGLYSTAMGRICVASGIGATAMGYSTASGDYSVAEGMSTASNTYATAMGNEAIASGYASIAVGESTATEYGAAAVGRSTASGGFSTAMGESTASGDGSTSSGRYTEASGDVSTATGFYSTASGIGSTVSGEYTTAQARDSVVIGTYNVGGGNSTSWISTDPLLELGNGTDSSHLSDAFVVYKNGNAMVQGSATAGTNFTAPVFITTTAAGDIPMFTGE